jgi:hypothetical protein
MIGGFVKMNKSEELYDLLKNRTALILLILISARVRRSSSANGLEVGEAFIGASDVFLSAGLTPREYRTAVKTLEKWGTIEAKATNKGTIVRLLDTTVFDPNICEGDKQATRRRQADDKQATSKRQAGDKQTTTNKKDKKDKKDKNENENVSNTQADGQDDFFLEPDQICRPKKFSPPTLEEVTAYCLERRRGVDPKRWHNFYEAKGWMIGKTKMKDWRAAVRTWEESTLDEKKATKPEKDYSW